MSFRHGLLQFPERHGFAYLSNGRYVAERSVTLHGYSSAQDSCDEQTFNKGDVIKRIANGDAFTFSRWEREQVIR